MNFCKYQRSPSERPKCVVCVGGAERHTVWRFFLYRVPLVCRDNKTVFFPLNQPGEFPVLHSDSIQAVNHKQSNIRSFQLFKSFLRAENFYLITVVQPGFFAETGSVNNSDQVSVIRKFRIVWISCFLPY